MAKKRKRPNLEKLGVRTRGSKWLPDETSVLINAVYEKQDILSAKHETYGGTNKARQKAWLDITKLVNASFMRNRTILQCFNKCRYVTCKAKKDYAKLLSKYGRTGAKGISKARKKLSEVELLSLEIKGLVSVEGLDLDPSVTGEELETQESNYVRPKSISNQVVDENSAPNEEDSSEEDLSDEEEEEDEDKDLSPPRHGRFKPIGRPPKRSRVESRESSYSESYGEERSTGSAAYVQRNRTSTPKHTSMYDKLPDMTIPKSRRPRTPSPGINSVRANNILLEKLLRGQDKIKEDIHEMKSDLKAIHGKIHTEYMIRSSSAQRMSKSTTSGYSSTGMSYKSNVYASSSTQYEDEPSDFERRRKTRSPHVSPLNLTKKFISNSPPKKGLKKSPTPDKTYKKKSSPKAQKKSKENISDSETESLEDSENPDPLLDIPTFSQQDQTGKELLEEMYKSKKFEKPTMASPDESDTVENVSKEGKSKKGEHSKEKGHKLEAPSHTLPPKKRIFKQTSPIESTTKNPSSPKKGLDAKKKKGNQKGKNLPRVDVPNTPASGDIEEEEDYRLTLDETKLPQNRTFTIKELQHAIKDYVQSLHPQQWEDIIALSKTRRSVFQQYDNKASHIFCDINDSEETEICEFTMHLMPKDM